MVPDKTVSFATLSPHVDFVSPEKISDAVECKGCMFFLLPKVILDLKQVFKSEFQAFDTLKTRLFLQFN